MSIGLQSVPPLSRKPPSRRWLNPFWVALVAFLFTLLPGYFLGRHVEDARRFAAWKKEWSAAASKAILTRISPISPAEPNRIHLNERQVGELLTGHFECDYWDTVGGPGHLEVLSGGVLVIASPEIHHKIRQALDRLETLPLRPDSIQPVPLFERRITEQERELSLALDRITSLSYQNVSLRKILEDISRREGVQILPATKKLEEAAFDLEVGRTIEVRNISLRACLIHLLRDLGLTFLIKDGLVQVTIPEDASYQSYTVLYPVHDLLECDRQETTERLAYKLTCFVEPDSWSDVGGPGEAVAIADGWIWVSQQPDVHAKFEIFLGKLRHKLGTSAWRESDERPAQRAERAIWSRLDATDGPELGNLPLRDVLARIEKHVQAQVILDPRLSVAESPEEILVRRTFSDVRPFSRKLATTLQETGQEVTFRVDHEVLSIGEGKYPHLQRLFDVRDLTAADGGLAGPDDLCAFIKAAVDVESWDDSGGPGTIICVAGCLAVENRLECILEIESLLEVLRTHRAELPQIARATWQQLIMVRGYALEEGEEKIPDRGAAHLRSYRKYVREFPFLDWQRRQGNRGASGAWGPPF